MILTDLPVPVGPGHRTCLDFVNRSLAKYFILFESRVGTQI